MLQTERLVLRRWLPRDRAPFAAMNADPEVMDFPGPLPPEDSDAEIAYFEACWDADGFGFAAVERKQDNALVGMCGIACCRMDAPICPCVEIGWRLARAHWGRGYATEAARAWLAHGLGTLELPEILAFTDPANQRSLAVMWRLGMRRDPARDFDHPAMPEGHPLRPHLVYALPRAAWVDRGGSSEPALAPRAGR
jgi:RimJ/RimL family protein N-acetyltransferase